MDDGHSQFLKGGSRKDCGGRALGSHEDPSYLV